MHRRSPASLRNGTGSPSSPPLRHGARSNPHSHLSPQYQYQSLSGTSPPHIKDNGQPKRLDFETSDPTSPSTVSTASASALAQACHYSSSCSCEYSCSSSGTSSSSPSSPSSSSSSSAASTEASTTMRLPLTPRDKPQSADPRRSVGGREMDRQKHRHGGWLLSCFGTQTKLARHQGHQSHQGRQPHRSRRYKSSSIITFIVAATLIAWMGSVSFVCVYLQRTALHPQATFGGHKQLQKSEGARSAESIISKPHSTGQSHLRSSFLRTHYRHPLEDSTAINQALHEASALNVASISTPTAQPDSDYPKGTANAINTVNTVNAASATRASATTTGSMPASAMSASPTQPHNGIVHIIHTRFMQNQPNLLDLGYARLELLRVFFLKTMLLQTSNNFLLVIRTDPNLHPSLRDKLLDLIQSFERQQLASASAAHQGAAQQDPAHRSAPIVLLIASNDIPSSQYSSILTPLSGDAAIWHGDMERAQNYLLSVINPTAATVTATGSPATNRYMHDTPDDHNSTSNGTKNSDSENSGNNSDNANSSSTETGMHPSIVLETRLDADDGLHKQFVEHIQNVARSDLAHVVTKSIRWESLPWRIWCPGRHMEWQYQSLIDANGSGDGDGNANGDDKDTDKATDIHSEASMGSLFLLRVKECVTAGLTIGFVLPTTTSPSPPPFPPPPPLPSSLPAPINSQSDQQYDQEQQLVPIQQLQTIQLPHHRHTSLRKDVKSCNEDKNRTIHCVSTLELIPTALRARTPTSAGMRNVLHSPKHRNHPSTGTAGIMGTMGMDSESTNSTNSINSVNSTSAMERGSSRTSTKDNNNANDANEEYRKRGAQKQLQQQGKLWSIAKSRFGMSQHDGSEMHRYLQSRLSAIAHDNWVGQCTHGHSCKTSSRLVLESMMKE